MRGLSPRRGRARRAARRRTRAPPGWCAGGRPDLRPARRAGTRATRSSSSTAASTAAVPASPAGIGTPSSVPIDTTVARAISRETSRSWPIGGYRAPAARRSSETSPARVRAATRKCASSIRRAPATIAPRPTPGKMKALLAWPMIRTPSAVSTGANGLPVATRARPSVQSRTWAGVASVREVGLESGKMIGVGVASAIARTTSSVKTPGGAGRPDEDRWPDGAHHAQQVGAAGEVPAPRASCRAARTRACRPRARAAPG